jgi:pimeloyl-ACP methyl ester carboxylesterase
MTESVGSAASTISEHELLTELVPSPVSYRVLRPPQVMDPGPEGLPLLLMLHGGGDSAEFLATVRPLFDGLWADGTLPPMLVATPSAGRSFYLDYFDRSQLWEQFLLDEFLPRLIEETGAGRGGAAVALTGVSMGGLGSLRLAFRRPGLFVAVAALEPALEESSSWNDVSLRDRAYRDGELMRELFGDPVDPAYFRANHPRDLAERNGHLIGAAGLDIYIECGDEDRLHLQYGSEALHRQLFAHGIDHEYRLVRGGNHLGSSLAGRFTDALRFVGRSIADLDRPESAPDPALEMLTEFITAAESDCGYRRTELIAGPDGPLEVHIRGEGPSLVMIPSLGRGAEDFDTLSARVARAGYRVISPEPRGIGRSDSTLDGLSMADLADDVAAVIESVGNAPAVIVGHAFGNRVARMVATRHPALVESVVLLACGGLIPPAPDVAAALRAVFDTELSPEDHLAAVDLGFFAPGNDAAVWNEGWHGVVAFFQGVANQGTPVETWWTAGSADVLVVQPADDVIAVPENGQGIVDTLGDRASMITIPNAGHALLPEQPAAVAIALLTWLDRRFG